MNTPTPLFRRLLPLALACGVLAALSPAAQAQEAAKPDFRGCDFLNVTITGSKAKVINVTCDSGSFDRYEPASGEIHTGVPVLVVLKQSGAAGPGCTITVSGGSETAVLRVEQNLCALKAGEVRGSVVSGKAKLVSSSRGAFPSQPGRLGFALGF